MGSKIFVNDWAFGKDWTVEKQDLLQGQVGGQQDLWPGWGRAVYAICQGYERGGTKPLARIGQRGNRNFSKDRTEKEQDLWQEYGRGVTGSLARIGQSGRLSGCLSRVGQSGSRIFVKDRAEEEQDLWQEYGIGGAGSFARIGQRGARSLGRIGQRGARSLSTIGQWGSRIFGKDRVEGEKDFLQG